MLQTVLKNQTVTSHRSVFIRFPLQTLYYRVGNRSALDWVIDQYQVKQDKRSGIHSDPNREAHPDHIVLCWAVG
jgi:predicted helicase